MKLKKMVIAILIAGASLVGAAGIAAAASGHSGVSASSDYFYHD